MSAVDHGSRAHALYAPSSADRWLECWDAPDLEDKYGTDSQSEASEKGTLNHECSEDCFEQNLNPRDISEGRQATWKDAAGVEHVARQTAEELRFHVVPYVEGVRYLADEGELLCHDVEILIEKRVPIVGEECFGTLDASVVWPGVVHCCDLKAGRYIVQADKPQFKTYLLGFAKKYVPVAERKNTRFFAHVFQAADEAEPHKVVEYSWSELVAHQIKIEEAIAGSRLREGDWCHFCKGKAGCQFHIDAHEKTMALFDEDLDEELIAPNVENLGPDKLKMLITNAPKVRDFLKAVDAYVFKHLSSGQPLLGYKLIRKSGRRTWDPDKTEAELIEEIEMLGVEDCYTHKLIAFSKVEKLAKKVGTNIDSLLIKPEGGLAVVSEDHPTAAYNPLEDFDDDI